MRSEAVFAAAGSVEKGAADVYSTCRFGTKVLSSSIPLAQHRQIVGATAPPWRASESACYVLAVGWSQVRIR